MADLLTEIADGVGLLTMNRPQRRNALSDEMVDAMGEVLTDWRDDPTVGAVVLTGAGAAFSAGGDITDFAARGGLNDGLSEPDLANIEWLRNGQRETVQRIHQYPKPVIAAISGAAAGAGLGLALACDLRIGTEKSVFATAFASVGLSGDYGVTWHLTRLVGPARARQMLLAGDKISGEQALSWGLLNWLVEPSDLMDTALTLATRLAAGPRLAFAQMKRNFTFAAESDLEASLEFEAVSQIESAASADHREGVAAFIEKRTPVFGEH